jgi:AcrR family transcriptional regulator
MEMSARPLRLKGADRRAQIVDMAFGALAEKGFEGLRVRDVAERACINIATLHHYFPSKEALVVAIAERLEQVYATGRSTPETDAATPPSLVALRREFADVTFIRREHRQVWDVSRELIMRAARDPGVAAIVDRLNEAWCLTVQRVLAAGRDSGLFRPDLDPAAAAQTIVSALWGAAVLLRATDEQFEALYHELESWLTCESPPK